MIEWLFCYLRSTVAQTEINWKEEAEAAEECGFTCHSFDMERFLDGDAEGAFEGLPKGEGRTIVYRGWILQEEEYQALEDHLQQRGYQLLTNSSQYMEALALPNWHPLVPDLTPPAVWTCDTDIDEAWELARTLGPAPYIVKDHVKSCKEAWLEACFVPKGARRAKFQSICKELIERRGERFQGGIVVRPYAPLRLITADWTGKPIFEEYRLVFWRGKMILAAAYSEVGRDEVDESGDLESWRREAARKFGSLGKRIRSEYFVADVARTVEGELILIEINDGSIAGFPPTVHPVEFYAAVAEAEGVSIGVDDEEDAEDVDFRDDEDEGAEREDHERDTEDEDDDEWKALE